MSKVFALAVGVILLICLVGCSSKDKQGFYGTYTFEEVSYLSPLSSTTIDYDNEKIAGTKYTIEADLFRIKSSDNEVNVEIKSPNYIKEDIPDDFSLLSDVHTFIGKEVMYQYTIFDKDGIATHYRIYTSADCLWVASYADNTANGSEIIMRIVRVK